MNNSQDTNASALDEARSMVIRGDYADARVVLMELVRRDPECTEAANLLLSLDEGTESPAVTAYSDDSLSDLREDPIGSVRRFVRRRFVIGNRKLIWGLLTMTMALWLIFAGTTLTKRGFVFKRTRYGRTRVLTANDLVGFGLILAVPGTWYVVSGLMDRERDDIDADNDL